MYIHFIFSNNNISKYHNNSNHVHLPLQNIIINIKRKYTFLYLSNQPYTKHPSLKIKTHNFIPAHTYAIV